MTNTINCQKCSNHNYAEYSVYHFAKHTNNVAAKYLVESYVTEPKFITKFLGGATIAGLVATVLFSSLAASLGALAGPILIAVIIGIVTLAAGGATGVNVWKSERAKKQFKKQPANEVVSRYNANKPLPDCGLLKSHLYFRVTNQQIADDISKMKRSLVELENKS